MSYFPRRSKKRDEHFTPLMCCEVKGHRNYDPYETTHQREYVRLPEISENLGNPGLSVRNRNRLAMEGVPARLMFNHHSAKAKYGMNTMYGQEYNRIPRINQLPPTRFFDVHKGSHGGWSPEKSDHPAIANPFRYGLAEYTEEKWRKVEREAKENEFKPESSRYSRYGAKAYAWDAQRFATPRWMSSKFFNPNESVSARPGHPILNKPNELTNITDPLLKEKVCRLQEARRVWQETVQQANKQEKETG